MPFQVRQETRPNSVGRDPIVWILEYDAGDCLEVWPAMGFNAYRWTVGGAEILYRDPAFFDGAKPTRSGWPILFPFPNRIRDGRFTWDGKNYQLPLGDPSGKNAIHGFVVNRPWRVVEHGADETAAWITGEIDSIRDLGDVCELWPGDYRLSVTYRMHFGGRLDIMAQVENIGSKSLPFGLGYHPYFRVAPFGGDAAGIELEASRQWKLEECLPTGAMAAFSWPEQTYGDIELDDLLTELPICRPETRFCGAIQGVDGLRLVVEASRDFGELVVFTPPHRQAICFEPYTCTTDALNLHARGINTGLQVLPCGQTWRGIVHVSIFKGPCAAA